MFAHDWLTIAFNSDLALLSEFNTSQLPVCVLWYKGIEDLEGKAKEEEARQRRRAHFSGTGLKDQAEWVYTEPVLFSK